MDMALSLSNLPWLWPAIGAYVLLLVLAAWSYRRAVGGWRWAGLSLKALGLALLALCLLEPVWIGQRAKPGANTVAVVDAIKAALPTICCASACRGPGVSS